MAQKTNIMVNESVLHNYGFQFSFFNIPGFKLVDTSLRTGLNVFIANQEYENL